jgi:hypothetical protein
MLFSQFFPLVENTGLQQSSVKTLEIAARLGAIRRHVDGIAEAAITHFLLSLPHYLLHIYLHPVPSYQ